MKSKLQAEQQAEQAAAAAKAVHVLSIELKVKVSNRVGRYVESEQHIFC